MAENFEKGKMFFYEEKFAKEFDLKMNKYDLAKRLEVVFNELLSENISGKQLLDAGCGTGWFSQAAFERGADVTSMDLGENLLMEVAKKCSTKRVAGSIMEMPFGNETFDIIVSSEVIEHVTDYKKAIAEFSRVLKPGGILILTTPNKLWYFSIWIANKLNLRPYQGLENWISIPELIKTLNQSGLTIEKKVGVHLFPFVLKITYPILNYFHRYNRALSPYMVNVAVRAKKASR